MRVRAGSLRDRLTLERPQYSPDGAGGRVETWVSVASVWGQVGARMSLVEGAVDAIVDRLWAGVV